jgi:lincosamide and streptogramin A transport system ATP-binding/permease protein
MSTVAVKNLTFGYDGSSDNVFENVSFQFDTDWKLGFVSRNGRGKTTFLRLLTGEFAYSGSIASPVTFSYFPFPVTDSGMNTLDIIDSIDPDYEFWELCRELNLLEVSEDVLFRPFESLSFGERTKTLMAAMFLRKDRFLLLDEPTNHLDQKGKRIIARYLTGKRGFLLVSHDRALLDAVTDHTLSINKTDIEIQSGSFSQWLCNKERRDRFEEDENSKLKKDIDRMKRAARRTNDWSNKVEGTKTGNGPVDRGFIGHKSAKMMKRSKSIEARRQDAVQKKSGLLQNVESVGTLKLSPLHYHADRLARVMDLSVNYGEATVFEGLSFTVHRGDRLSLSGGNGSGKSSIIKLIIGEDIPHGGSVSISSGVRISYVSQDTSMLSGDMRSFADDAGIDYTLFLAILRNFGLERSHFDSDLADLSEGQKKKILIARSLSESAHLYVWDEPLNFIDIPSRMQIEELLLKYEPTMIFVEHDEVFTDKVSTSKIEL